MRASAIDSHARTFPSRSWVLNSKVSFSAASKDYQMGRYTQSLATLNQLMDIQQDAKTYALLAKNLLQLGFKADAAKAYGLAGNCEGPNSYEYQKQAAKLHYETGNEDDALLIAMRNLAKAQEDPELAFIITAIYLKRQQRDIIRPFKTVLSQSQNPDHMRLAALLLSDDLNDPTNQSLSRNLFKRFPGNLAFRFLHLVFAREFNEFEEASKHQAVINAALAKGEVEILRKDNPFYHLHWCGNEDFNRYATIGFAPLNPERVSFRRSQPHSWSDKIRIGYMSSDFWDCHATMKLLQRILELHDKDRFDVTLFCHTGPEYLEHNTTDRSRWGRIVTVHGFSDQAVLEVVREHNIDIMVDLKGHTSGSRATAFNLPLAPVHVGWLGFPGSTVNIDLDYVIGDHSVLPEAAKPFYHEKFCRLPESYQPNDPMHRPKPRPVTREQLGLPEDAFIFASFNGNRKITPETIDSWCRILKRAPNSVLWLMANTPRNQANLLKQFQTAGISPKRIIFCPRAPYEEHIDRQQAADLGIDTFPVNGHTTTSEQLWGGLPVLTVKGTNFASRVSESLLRAIDLPDLVAADLQAYEDMAVELAENPGRIAEYKAHLREKRYIAPLFDAERFCDHLEKAYEAMAERAKQGLAPDHMDIPALPPRTAPFAAE
ncbi:glycosyl transferase [Rhizobium leguminosarum]|uniref:O-linked N-acetylglucosamine transferase, SPINDLY family protein n=1 Tax=Rhizobium leguminosarum TaxID=384 RepID=UPI001C942229|nr:glycosyl transferase [Rhizobium leguminosarum]MBY5599650.1 glycosyl transferase [Rhizobium leguminosarum]